MEIPQWLGYVIIAIIGFILIAYLVVSGLLPAALDKIGLLDTYVP